MADNDQIINDITRLIHHIPRTDILRLIRRFVCRMMTNAGMDPDVILHSGD